MAQNVNSFHRSTRARPPDDIVEEVPEMNLFRRLAEAIGEDLISVCNMQERERNELMMTLGLNSRVSSDLQEPSINSLIESNDEDEKNGERDDKVTEPASAPPTSTSLGIKRKVFFPSRMNNKKAKPCEEVKATLTNGSSSTISSSSSSTISSTTSSTSSSNDIQTKVPEGSLSAQSKVPGGSLPSQTKVPGGSLPSQTKVPGGSLTSQSKKPGGSPSAQPKETGGDLSLQPKEPGGHLEKMAAATGESSEKPGVNVDENSTTNGKDVYQINDEDDRAVSPVFKRKFKKLGSGRISFENLTSEKKQGGTVNSSGLPAFPTQTDSPGKPASPTQTESPGPPASPTPTDSPGKPASPTQTESPGLPASPTPTESPGKPAFPNPTESPGKPASPTPTESPGKPASPKQLKSPTSQPVTSANSSGNSTPASSPQVGEEKTVGSRKSGSGLRASWPSYDLPALAAQCRLPSSSRHSGHTATTPTAQPPSNGDDGKVSPMEQEDGEEKKVVTVEGEHEKDEEEEEKKRAAVEGEHEKEKEEEDMTFSPAKWVEVATSRGADFQDADGLKALLVSDVLPLHLSLRRARDRPRFNPDNILREAKEREAMVERLQQDLRVFQDKVSGGEEQVAGLEADLSGRVRRMMRNRIIEKDENQVWCRMGVKTVSKDVNLGVKKSRSLVDQIPDDDDDDFVDVGINTPAKATVQIFDKNDADWQDSSQGKNKGKGRGKGNSNRLRLSQEKNSSPYPPKAVSKILEIVEEEEEEEEEIQYLGETLLLEGSTRRKACPLCDRSFDYQSDLEIHAASCQDV